MRMRFALFMILASGVLLCAAFAADPLTAPLLSILDRFTGPDIPAVGPVEPGPTLGA
jgi:hypothetical protein